MPLPVPPRAKFAFAFVPAGFAIRICTLWKGIYRFPSFPVVPGHQIVGTVDALGEGVAEFREGDRVGVPWLYSTDGTCAYCRKGLETSATGAVHGLSC